MENSICIKNARIVDGTGAAAYTGDVLISGERIVKIGRNIPAGSAKVIEAEGMYCTPGFIDVHTHSDISLLYCGNPRGHIMQGITSEVTGNCGYGVYPLKADRSFVEKRRASMSLIDTPLVSWDWQSFGEYCERLKNRQINTNVRTLIGYGSVRAFVMDYDNRAPSAREQEEIEQYIDTMLKEGACGLSVGLGYAPDFYADTGELIKAARVVKKNNGIFAFHIRGERATLFNAIDEVLTVARETGVRTEISHLKCAGVTNHGHIGEIIESIEKANSQGADITFDIYPYEAGCSYLGLVFPPVYHEGGIEKLLERLEDPQLLPQILHDMVFGYAGWSTFIGERNGENLLISATADGKNVGKTVAGLGREWNMSACEAAVKLMVENEGAVEMIMFQCIAEDVTEAEIHPLCMFGSDSMAMDPEYSRLRERPHPRYYGTFPTVLTHFREKKNIPLEALIKKMTGLPAERFGFRDRGVIKENYFADLCLFRLEDIDASAAYTDPNRLAKGMHTVIVNGCIEVENGSATKTAAGKLLT